MAHTPLSLNLTLEQYPEPQQHLVRHTGDSLRITLTLSQAIEGRAFLRTNLGNARIHWQEVVEKYERGTAILGRDWTDLPMRQLDSKHYEIVLPMCEVGMFEFKAYFLQESIGRSWWPRGENSRVKVESAITYANNTIYNAFVRQFGQHKRPTPAQQQVIDELDKSNWTVIPPSGTFRDVSKKLDFIQKELGFRILQFLPIHPTPTTYARMGRYGSPFAPLDFMDADAGMAEFDQRTTPLEQFRELIGEVHCRGGLVVMDLPIDHTGWASEFQARHPEWFCRNHDGSFQSPGAWGVVWADLCKLDFNRSELWQEIAEVFLHWCRCGVDGFRCDAGYMVPAPVWEYIVAKVRLQFPDTIFFLEGLGGGIDATTALLSKSGLDWAYSELFQNYTADQISHYMDFATRYSAANGALVHFAETHDNDRLAKQGPNWAKMRVAMAALFAPAGCFGIANGVEWLATEKIDVHGASDLNWDSEKNLVSWLQKLNRLLREHPAFRADAAMRVPYGAAGSGTGLLRIPANNPEHTLLIVVNPQLNAPAEFEWNLEEFDASGSPVDILTGRRIPVRYDQCQIKVPLKPAEVLCLCHPDHVQLPARKVNFVQRQLLRSAALVFLTKQKGYGDISNLDIDGLALALHRNPVEFLKKLNGVEQYLPVVKWYPNRDERRIVPIPPKHFLFVNHSGRFIAQLCIDGECVQKIYSVQRADGRHFALFHPIEKEIFKPTQAQLIVSAFLENGQISRVNSPLLLLPDGANVKVGTRVPRAALTRNHTGLATGKRGSYGLIRGKWGELDSQYDALLAVSQHPTMPVDKTVVLNRCRVWLIHRDYSQPIDFSCQSEFAVAGPNSFRWKFIVPTGMGGNIYLTILYSLDHETGRMRLTFTRCIPPSEKLRYVALDGDDPVTLLVRPDIDDRSFHSLTKAQPRREHDFPKRLHAAPTSFAFHLDSGNRLELKTNRGNFCTDSTWQYNHHLNLEAERGLACDCDLFSPGFFKFDLLRGEDATIEAQVLRIDDPPLATPAFTQLDSFNAVVANLPLEETLRKSLDAFVVIRDDFKSVIAGYPWFLDWGRDTLICTGGLLAAQKSEDVKAIIQVFASYEEAGTLPNIICGTQVGNRDTSDAPLLLFHAVRQFIDATGDDAILATLCGKRKLLDILVSIAENYITGTPNGIKADPKTGLIFSPAHFTWMDTNYPAATPRQGYPIEIQALWHSALRLLAQHTGDDRWTALADQVQVQANALFLNENVVGLSDCLHAKPGQSALDAVADDACRPNQLLAITLKLVTAPALCSDILMACSSLLVPGSIRSLADQPVTVPIPVEKDGRRLNDPYHPYWGYYAGDEDTRRKPAYHNGTAWGLMMPSYCEALVTTYGDSAKDAALSTLASAACLMTQGCLGHLPECVDGNAPHFHRACCAQAWSETECYRVLKLLTKE